MRVTTGLVRHLSVVLLGLTTASAAVTARQTPDPAGSSTFLVLVGGTRVGTETVSLTRSGSGWLLSATGRLQVPFDLTTNAFEVAYASDWQPQRLSLDALVRGQALMLTTTFGLTSATDDVTQGAQHGTFTHQVTPRAIVLSSNVFSAYEALAIRVAGVPVGSRIPLYIAPSGETNAVVDDVTPRRISVGAETIDVRAYRLTIAGSSGAVPVELWVDARGRLARLALPTSSVVVLRDDLASVMAREETVRNPDDEEAFVGANGFSLGATLTHPASAPARAGAPARAPAVVLVSGPGPQDRDYNVYGVPIFGQLAGALARAGQIVVRYDVRGVGRSGGRAESARLAEYSEDVVNIVSWLRRRKDVDADRIVIVGYGNAAPIAMLAASRDKHIDGLALLAAPSGTGREITLAEQQRVLAHIAIPAAAKSSRLALQTRVLDAVLSGKGWDALPDDVREQADTAWFKSWLEFDPAEAFKRMKQPVLVVQGALDMEVPADAAASLAALARSARPKLPATATRTVIVDGVNHLLVPAATGATDEYPTLHDRTISPDVVRALTEWLAGVGTQS
jgi:pimeloyl-ACP methyl ester carboxylesterase